jgi:hypothetical protein
MTAYEHVPVPMYFDEFRVTTPGEVCLACSDPDIGLWVPASFCERASQVMETRRREREDEENLNLLLDWAGHAREEQEPEAKGAGGELAQLAGVSLHKRF